MAWHKHPPPLKSTVRIALRVISLDVSDTGQLRDVCQIGRAYSAEELSIAKEEQVENGFWSSIGLLEHLEEVDRHLFERSRKGTTIDFR